MGLDNFLFFNIKGWNFAWLEFDTKMKPVAVACPEAELLLHEEVHHLLREGDHVVNTHVNVVVHAKRDHFSK